MLFQVIFMIAGVLLGIYLYCYIRRVLLFWNIDRNKTVFRILAAVLAGTIILQCRNIWSFKTVVILHFIAFAIVFDVLALVKRKFFHSREMGKRAWICRILYGSGLFPAVLTVTLLLYGFFNIDHAVKTEYYLNTEKNVKDYKIILLTDIHYGTIQDTGILKNKIEEISEQSPDIVVLGGDIVEEGTSKEQMEEVFRILGGIENKHGIYYVYGNHDRQPYTRNRSYTNEELEAAITGNGITILEDRYVEIGEDMILAGRGDAAWGNRSGRASTEKILEDVSREKYIIVADHQPIEAEENSAQGVDLEVSGHTHAGQIWPVGILSELAGILNYGEYDRGNCKVIVSSGFTGWGYPVRTEEHCEYVLIHLDGTAN